MGQSINKQYSSYQSNDELIRYISNYGINLEKAIKIDQIDLWLKYNVYSLQLNFSEMFGNNLDLFYQAIYDKQRPIDYNRAGAMANIINKKENHHWGAIYVGFVYNSPPKIIDGQHRLTCLQYLDCDKIFNCHLHLIQFEKEEELFNYFCDINQNIQVPLKYLDCNSVYKDITNYICQKMLEKYYPVISKTNNLFPYLNINTLEEWVYNIISNSSYHSQTFSLGDPESTINEYFEYLLDFTEKLNQLPINNHIFLNNIKKQQYNIINKANCRLVLLNNFTFHFQSYLELVLKSKITTNDEEYTEAQSTSEHDSATNDSTTNDNAINDNAINEKEEIIEKITQICCKEMAGCLLKFSNKPHPPNINRIQIIELIGLIVNQKVEEDNVDVDDIISQLKKFNQYLGTLPANSQIFKNKNNNPKLRQKRHSIAKESNFFFGLVYNLEENFLNWLER